MKRENKFKLLYSLLFLLIGIFLINSVSANMCNLDISLVNQEPSPAIPGDYVDVVFQISGVQDSNCEGAWSELDISYPFSLDENDTLRTLKGSTWTPDYKNEWMIAYKLRVDKDAFDGTPEIKIRYAPGTWGFDSYIIEKFNISIEDSRTDFDAVIQEVEGSEVSIAIANTGKDTANSVIVRIPEQEGFKATGTDGQMVGNLDAGDYTILGFSLIPLAQGDSQKKNLQFDIYYTDAIGERRVVNMETPLKISSGGNGIPGSKKGMKEEQTSETNWTFWSFWIILGIIIIGCFIVYKRYAKQTKTSSNLIPDWIKNDNEKKK